jgi:type I restriction enzyme S subunit
MNQLGKPHGSLGVSGYEGIISPAYFVAEIGPAAVPRFIHHLLRTRLYISEYERRGKFMPPSQFDISWEQFQTIPIALPPLVEQRAIADYLDRETARIDALIAAKQRLLVLLDERLSVTKERSIWNGGAVRLLALRRICRLIKDGTHQPPARVLDGYPLLSVRNLFGGSLQLRDDDSLVSADDYRELIRAWHIQPDDVVLAIVGATLGKVGMVGVLPPVAIQRSLAVLRVRPSVCVPRFLYHALSTRSFQDTLWSAVGFSAQPGVYLGAVAGMAIPVPDPLTQQAVVRELDALETWSTTSRLVIEHQVRLLRERREALITAAVTGQISVSVAA